MTQPTLHLVRGDSAGDNRRPPLRVVSSWDTFTRGKVPPIRDLPAWMRARAELWGKAPPRRDLYRLLADAPQTLRDTDIVVWPGPSLDEQLFVAFMAEVLTLLEVDLARVRVAELTRNQRGEEVCSFSLIGPSAFVESLARPVDPTQWDRWLRGWEAFTAPRPEAVFGFLAREPACLFTDRLALLARRYPTAEDGLPPWDRRLLELVGADDVTLVDVVMRSVRTGVFDELDSPGDITIRERLLHLGRPGLRRPLIEVDGDRIRCTAHGRRVLAYERRADVSVIFDFVGGVRLDGQNVRAWYALSTAAGRAAAVPAAPPDPE